MDTIIITGAGTGIGAAAARKLSQRRDVRLVLVGRRLEPLEQVAAECAAPVVAVPMDVADRPSWETLLASDAVDLGQHPLVGLFANAGIGGPNQFSDGAADRWEEVIRVNLTGTYISGEACKPYFDRSRDRGPRHVVVTSSVLARFGVPGQPAYVASKTGLLGLVRSWAAAWSGDGILVNAICPGWVETEMARASIQALADAAGRSFEEERAVQAGLLPTGRMSQPEEVGAFVAWLMSGEQVSITGQGLDINNGSFMM